MTLRIAALAAALLLVLPAGAQALAFSIADLNHDGVVTWPEARRVFPRLAEVHFHKCDPNGDGIITQAEYPLLNNFYWQIYVMD